jgi:DNA-binding transcriptional ArsR family regulator
MMARRPRRLLDRLHAKNGQTLGELCQGLDMTRQSVGKHLSILEEANLISWKRQGRESFTLSIQFQAMTSRNVGLPSSSATNWEALADLKKQLERRSALEIDDARGGRCRCRRRFGVRSA